MSKVDVIMPQMGESIAEGTLTRWLKNVGDAVQRDEDLFEISTDKVDADIPSPATGTLTEILVQEGDTVEVNSVVARIDTSGEGDGDVAEAAEAAPAVAEQPEAAAAPGPPVEETTPEPVAAAPEAEPEAEPEAGDATGPMTREERLRTKSTPLVRKLAEEHGVKISQITGTGIAGRVTRDDLLAYLESRPAVAAEEAPAATPSAPAPVPGMPVAAPSTGEPGVMRVPIHGATLDIKIPLHGELLNRRAAQELELLLGRPKPRRQRFGVFQRRCVLVTRHSLALHEPGESIGLAFRLQVLRPDCCHRGFL